MTVDRDVIEVLVSLAIVLPLFGTIVLLTLGKRIGEPIAGWIATATVSLAFVGAAISAISLKRNSIFWAMRRRTTVSC